MYRIYFDTETTGLKPGHIVQMSVIIEDEGRVVGAKNYYFDTDYIEEGAVDVHGITVEKLHILSGGKLFADYADEIARVFNNSEIVAHNVKFDENFLNVEMLNCNKAFKIAKRTDTVRLFTNVCKIPGKRGFKYPKLNEVEEHYNIDPDKVRMYAGQLFNDYEVTHHDSRYDTTAMYVVHKIYETMSVGRTDWLLAFCKSQ